jgi:predicted nucleotidyltransferase
LLNKHSAGMRGDRRRGPRGNSALRCDIRTAFVFGSAAREELHSDSDVDVLLVGDASFTAVAAP